jgi:hypothetical protein
MALCSVTTDSRNERSEGDIKGVMIIYRYTKRKTITQRWPSVVCVNMSFSS